MHPNNNHRNTFERWTDKATIKVLIPVLTIAGTALAFMVQRWMVALEPVLAESQSYTDKAIANHEAKMNPYVEDFKAMKPKVDKMSDDMQRITVFMELKFGMPREARSVRERRNDLQ